MDGSQSIISAQPLMMAVMSEHLPTMETQDQFDLLRELGRGTYGQVVLARNRRSGLCAALKHLPRSQVPRESFLAEFTTSALLSNHANIITTALMAWQTPDHYVFAQEVATSGTLRSLLIAEVGVEEEKVKRCMVQVSSALKYMHRNGLVHRDVKPDNVLLMDPDCHCVKLSDFGLTGMTGTWIPSMRSIIPYMAPELCRLMYPNTLLLDPSLDVWAFAMLIVTTLTGQVPFSQALMADSDFREFFWWQLRGPDSPVPTYWQQFAPEARQHFLKMLAGAPGARGSVDEIQQFIDLPWKEEKRILVMSSEEEVRAEGGAEEAERLEVLVLHSEQLARNSSAQFLLVLADGPETLPPGTALVLEFTDDQFTVSFKSDVEAT